MMQADYLGQHFEIRDVGYGWIGYDPETETELTGKYDTEKEAFKAAIASIEQADAEDPQFRYGGKWREMTGDPTLDNIPTEAEMLQEIARRKAQQMVNDLVEDLNPDDVIPYVPTALGWETATKQIADKEQQIADEDWEAQGEIPPRPSQYVHSPHSHPAHTDTLLMNAISRLVEALEAFKQIKKDIEGEAYHRIVSVEEQIGIAGVRAYVVRCMCVADQLEKAQQAGDEKQIAYWTQIQKQIEKGAITGKR